MRLSNYGQLGSYWPSKGHASQGFEEPILMKQMAHILTNQSYEFPHCFWKKHIAGHQYILWFEADRAGWLALDCKAMLVAKPDQHQTITNLD